MASIPAPQTPRRRRSSARDDSSTQRSLSIPVRTTSEDSEMILIRSPVTSEATKPTTTADEDDAKRCWICFSDSTEDTPESSPWRDPCPCALVAHEECLLDWIADKESPSSRRGGMDVKIECPQCKTEIKLSRPRDYLVDLVRGVERLGARIVVPGAAFTITAIAYSSSMAWGIHSVYAIFGSDDGYRILRPLIYNATRAPVEVYIGSPRDALKHLLGVYIHHLQHWRVYIGLPLITPMLILSRTSIADSFLPLVPMLFFASQMSVITEPVSVLNWPPSASFTFAILPYVRAGYNALYKQLFAEKKARWLREIQPRSTQSQNDNGDGAGDADDGNAVNVPRPADDENIFEVRIDGGIWEEWEDNGGLIDPDQANAGGDNNADNAAPAPNVPRPVQQPQAAGDGAAANAPAQAAAAQQPQQQNANANANAPAAGERRLAFSPTLIAENIIGALLFPTIAGIAGEALKLVLPTAWTTPGIISPRFGPKFATKKFLSQKWARSIVGGCLFVVCKDALVLYTRWKMAQMHRSRRVVDYDRSKAKKSSK